MNQHDPVVIVGGGLAGATAAFALRERGIDGRVVVVGEEPQLPYERPPLSKGYLRGEEPLENAFVKPAAEYESQSIELLRGRRAVQLDPVARRLNLDDGTDLAYGALLLATGSAPRKLSVPGSDVWSSLLTVMAVIHQSGYHPAAVHVVTPDAFRPPAAA